MANHKSFEKPNSPPGGEKKRGGARPDAGRPAFVPTDQERKQVEALSGYGLSQENIRVLIRDGISMDTLREHFKKELLSGKAKANAQVTKSIFQKVLAGDAGMMRYWAATQLGWRETQHVEHTGKDGAPIAVASVNFKNLTDAELAQMQALMTKAKESDDE